MANKILTDSMRSGEAKCTILNSPPREYRGKEPTNHLTTSEALDWVFHAIMLARDKGPVGDYSLGN